MPNKQTLTSYIRALTADKLYKLHDYVVGEINRRKANEQNVDVGFWNSDGVYIPDIQKIDKSDEWNNIKEDEIVSCSDSDLLVWFDSQKGTPISEIYKDEFLKKVQDLALNYGLDFFSSSTIRGMYERLKNLDEDGFFDEEQGENNAKI